MSNWYQQLKVQSFLGQGESATVEFLAAPDPKLLETMCAFANTNGGYILVGVDDSGSIVGCRLPPVLEYIEEHGRDRLGVPTPVYDPREISVDGKTLVVVKVEKNNAGRPSRFSDNTLYVRRGASNQTLPFDDYMEAAQRIGLAQADANDPTLPGFAAGQGLAPGDVERTSQTGSTTPSQLGLGTDPSIAGGNLPGTTSSGTGVTRRSLFGPFLPFTVSREAEESQHCLRIEEYVEVLETLLRSAEGEFSLAIFGPWGRGKTTLCQRLAKRLQEVGRKTVFFSAWKYRTTPEVWVHLYETLAVHAGDTDWWYRYPRNFRAALHRSGVWPLILLLTAFAAAITPLWQWVSLGRLLIGVFGLFGVFFAAKLWFGLQNTLSQFFRQYLLPARHGEKLGLQAVIGHDLIALLRGWVRPGPKQSVWRKTLTHLRWVWIPVYVVAVIYVAIIMRWHPGPSPFANPWSLGAMRDYAAPWVQVVLIVFWLALVLVILPWCLWKVGFLQAVIGRDQIVLLRDWVWPGLARFRLLKAMIRLQWGWILLYMVAVVRIAIIMRWHPGEDPVWKVWSVGEVREYAPLWFHLTLIAVWLSLTLLVLPLWLRKAGFLREPIVLFIDDLDRCEPDQMLSIVESLKIMLEDVPVRDRVQVIMLIEDYALHKAISKKYGYLIEDDSNLGHEPRFSESRLWHESTEKLFVLHLRLTKLRNEDIQEVMRSAILSLGDNGSTPAQSAGVTDENATQTEDGRSPIEVSSPPLFAVPGSAVAQANPSERSEPPMSQAVLQDEDRDALLWVTPFLGKSQLGLQPNPRSIRNFLHRYQLVKLLLHKSGTYAPPRTIAAAIAKGAGYAVEHPETEGVANDQVANFVAAIYQVS